MNNVAPMTAIHPQGMPAGRGPERELRICRQGCHRALDMRLEAHTGTPSAQRVIAGVMGDGHAGEQATRPDRGTKRYRPAWDEQAGDFHVSPHLVVLILNRARQC